MNTKKIRFQTKKKKKKDCSFIIKVFPIALALAGNVSERQGTKWGNRNELACCQGGLALEECVGRHMGSLHHSMVTIFSIAFSWTLYSPVKSAPGPPAIKLDCYQLHKAKVREN